jgi:hypothetical protein
VTFYYDPIIDNHHKLLLFASGPPVAGYLAAGKAATEGAWSRLATTTGSTRFDEPTVTGVDFPRVAMGRSW